jgi:hypothetical protein
MRVWLIACFVIWLTSLFPVAAVELSTTNDGIYVGIAGGLTGQYPIPFDTRLVWRPFSDSGALELNYPKPEFGVKVKMWGPDGRETPKTPLGRKFGSKFDSVQTYADVISGWSMGCIEAQGRYDRRDGPLLSGPMLPAPKDWFEMEQPGTYTLELQMQMFRIIKSTNQWTRKLIRLAPMKIKVEKPPERKANVSSTSQK